MALLVRGAVDEDTVGTAHCRLMIVCILLLSSTACATAMQLGNRRPIYAGTGFDLFVISGEIVAPVAATRPIVIAIPVWYRLLAALDLPFSFTADTLLLPITIPTQSRFDGNHGPGTNVRIAAAGYQRFTYERITVTVTSLDTGESNVGELLPPRLDDDFPMAILLPVPGRYMLSFDTLPETSAVVVVEEGRRETVDIELGPPGVLWLSIRNRRARPVDLKVVLRPLEIDLPEGVRHEPSAEVRCSLSSPYGDDVYLFVLPGSYEVGVFATDDGEKWQLLKTIARVKVEPRRTSCEWVNLP